MIKVKELQKMLGDEIRSRHEDGTLGPGLNEATSLKGAALRAFREVKRQMGVLDENETDELHEPDTNEINDLDTQSSFEVEIEENEEEPETVEDDIQ